MEMLVWTKDSEINEFESTEFGLTIAEIEKGIWTLYHTKRFICMPLCENKSFDFCLGYANGFADKNWSA